jgi:FixJ family two-component response regulator
MHAHKTSYHSKGDVYFIEGEFNNDSPLVRTSRLSLRNALQECGFNVMTCKGPAVFLHQTVPSSPAVLLFDTRLNDWSGIGLQLNLNQLEYEAPIIFLGNKGSTQEIVTAMKQGAIDFLAQPFTHKELCDVVEKAMLLNVDNTARFANEKAIRLRLKTLTTREREICFFMVGGYGNIEIAAFNGSSAGTVKIHRHRVLRKMGVETLAALVTQITSIEHIREHLRNTSIVPILVNVKK